jgi:hypothetical protein
MFPAYNKITALYRVLVLGEEPPAAPGKPSTNAGHSIFQEIKYLK